MFCYKTYSLLNFKYFTFNYFESLKEKKKKPPHTTFKYYSYCCMNILSVLQEAVYTQAGPIAYI